VTSQPQAKADARHVARSGLCHRRPHLRPLPDALPPVYELLERVVDLHGFVSVDTNRYSVPKRFTVNRSPSSSGRRDPGLPQDATIAVHPRLIGQRDARNTLPGHHTIRCGEPWHGTGRDLAARSSPQSRLLRAALKQHSNGWGGGRSASDQPETNLPSVRSSPPLNRPCTTACRPRPPRSLILKQVAGEFFALDAGDDSDA